jgi:hypothetical protein
VAYVGARRLEDAPALWIADVEGEAEPVEHELRAARDDALENAWVIAWAPDEQRVALGVESLTLRPDTNGPPETRRRLAVIDVKTGGAYSIGLAERRSGPPLDVGFAGGDPQPCYVDEGKLRVRPIDLPLEGPRSFEQRDITEAASACFPPGEDVVGVLRQRQRRWNVALYDPNTWQQRVERAVPAAAELDEQPRLLDVREGQALIESRHKGYVIDLESEGKMRRLGAMLGGALRDAERIVAARQGEIVLLDTTRPRLRETTLLTVAEVGEGEE